MEHIYKFNPKRSNRILRNSIRKDSIGALTLGRGAKGLMAEWLSHLGSQFDGEKLR